MSSPSTHEPSAVRAQPPSRSGSPRDRPVVAVEGLSYRLGGAQILDRISFSLARGERVAVMRPSGCGKMTLRKCLTRLLEPSAGRVPLDGEDVDALSPVELRRRIGLVWQTPFMFEGTVRDNLTRAAQYSHSGVGDDAFVDELRCVAFHGDPDADARSLSVGEQQRVAAARALVCRLSLLLCDEPTAALDHDNALRLEATFAELCAGGMTVVWVTHDPQEAERIGGRTLVLAEGALRELRAG